LADKRVAFVPFWGCAGRVDAGGALRVAILDHIRYNVYAFDFSGTLQ